MALLLGLLLVIKKKTFLYITLLCQLSRINSAILEGEYVTFSVTEADDKTTATSVTGPDGGKLMCETRRERRQQNESRRADRAADDSSDTPSKGRKQSSFRGGGPRSGENKERILVQMADEDDGTVWELVRHRGNKRRSNRRPQKTNPQDRIK